MKKRTTIIIAIILLVSLGAYLGAKGITAVHEKRIGAIALAKVDLLTIADGTYTGSHKVFPIDVEVKVTLQNHRITGIELVKHKNGQGTPAEIIPSKVVEAQSLEVDMVTGATSSSKVILKAIENALNSGLK